MNNSFKTATLFIFVFSASAFLSAQNIAASGSDDIIVVSAGKIEQNINDAVEKVQVVTKDEIEQSGAKTLSEAVKNLPGVTVKSASPGNPTDSISMQGFDSEYVKILVDGIAVSGDIGGSTAVFQIPVEDVDHIEVIQGASSALYGSDAMGGVINIITKKNENEYSGVKIHGALNEEFSYSINKDLRNYSSGSVSVSGENLSASLSGSFDYAPGVKKSSYYALAGGNVDYYETPKKELSFLRGSASWSDDWGKIGAYALFADGRQLSNYTPVGFSSGSTMEYDTKRAEGGILGEYSYDANLSFSGFSSVKGFFLNTDYDVNAGADSSTTDTASSFLDWESEARANYKLSDFNQILAGINGTVETLNGDSFGERKKQALLSFFAQDTISIGDVLQVVPGARFDFSPEIDGSGASYMLTPKLSLKYTPFTSTAVRFSYGMGYKTPSLKQKYWEFHHSYSSGEGNFILYGKADLKPEKSQSFNLGFEQSIFNLLKFSASGYFNYISDMIDSVVTDSASVPQIRTYVNIDKAVTYGGEASLGSGLGRFSGKIGYAYTGAKQEEDGEWLDMALRVTHRISGQISYLVPAAETKVSASAEWNSRQRIKAGEDEFTPDYFMASLGLSKMFFDEKLEIYVRADNIFNNRNFKSGTDGQNQKEYYALNAGTVFAIGGRFKF